MLDAQLLGEGIAAIVRQHVAKATESLQAEVTALRAELAARPDAKANSEAIARAVDEAFAAMPKPADGTSVTLEQVHPLIFAEVRHQVADIPRASDGESVTIDDVRPILALMVDAKFADVPKPKAITVDDVRPVIDAEVVRRIAELPKPIDGESVTLEDVRPIIDAEVARRVAEIPKAVDGTSVTLEHVHPLIIAEVKAQIADLPKPADGKSVTIEQVRPLVAELVAMIPAPKNGDSVTVEDVEPMLRLMVAAIPRPEDGKSVTVEEVERIATPVLERLVAKKAAGIADVREDVRRAFETLTIHAGSLGELREAGKALAAVVASTPQPEDGKSVTIDDVRPVLERMVAERVAALPKPVDGVSPHPDTVRLMVDDAVDAAVDAAIEKAVAQIRVPEDGADADPRMIAELVEASVARQFEILRPHIKGEPGDDGLGFDDIQASDVDGDGCVTLTLSRDGRVRQFKIAGFPHEAGVHVKGKAYGRGAISTYGGSAFIATRDTTAPIGGDSPSPDWRLLCKRGRDAT